MPDLDLCRQCGSKLEEDTSAKLPEGEAIRVRCSNPDCPTNQPVQEIKEPAPQAAGQTLYD